MINYTFKNGTLLFQVSVVPRASRSEIVGPRDGVLRVRIAAPPVEGAANKELVFIIAKALSVPRSLVEIRSGRTGRLKTVKVTGVAADALDLLK